MTRFTSRLENLAVPLPITSAARQAAAAFAQAQPTPAKADSVRLNTLAVWVVSDYCQLMEIPADRPSSDSWNPLMQLTSDVADLHLPGLGHLECRPVREGDTDCDIPPEVWDLRIGYVVVAIAADYQTAKLLGFCPQVESPTLPLSELQPPEAFLDHVYALQHASTGSEVATEQWLDATVNLRHWLQGLFETGWQSVEALLSPDDTLAFQFRGGDALTLPPLEGEFVADVSRAKLIDLVIRLGRQQVVLLVDLRREHSETWQIGLQVHPARPSPYLPPGLVLSVLESDRTLFMQAQSRDNDNFIQLQFNGQPNELFLVQIEWQGAIYIENFVI